MLQKIVLVGMLLVFGSAACADHASLSDQKNTDQIDAFAKVSRTSDNKNANAKLDSLLEDIDTIRKDANVAAVGIALVSKNEIIHVGGMGVQSLDTKKPATAQTLFRLGSITKSFTGLAALHMRRSQPDLFEQTVNSVIPDLLDPKYGGDSVRLPHLLEHTAGLSDLTAKEFAFQGETVTYKEAIKIDPSSRTLRWPAARHSSYSNAGFGFAGFLLEESAEQSYEQLVQTLVLKPLDMKTAGFFITEQTPTLAAGYNTDGITPIPYWHMLYRSFGGLNATPVDMSKFLQALLQPEGDGQLFENRQERARFENPHTTLAAGAGLDYGYGLGNYHWISNGLRFHGHGGDADGYLSHYGYVPDAGYAYFVVITAFNKKPLNKMRTRLERHIAGLPIVGIDAAVASDAATVKLDAKALAALTGNYAQVTRRFGALGQPGQTAMRISKRNGRLVTHYRGADTPLEAVSETLFKRPWQNAATYAFVVNSNGDTFLQGDMGNFKKLPARK